MISTSSFTPLSQGKKQKQINSDGEWEERITETVDAVLFPAFRHFRGLVPLPESNEKSADSAEVVHPHTESSPDPRFADTTPLSTAGSLKHFILENLTPSSSSTGAPVNQIASGEDAASSNSWESTPITNPTILICSHGSRDSRCGILGPVLHDEFRRYIDQQCSKLRTSEGGKFVASESAVQLEPSQAEGFGRRAINVGMISHVGGHKWAGNVILYIPPSFSTSSRPPTDLEQVSRQASGVPAPHPLAGISIWYGRVEPRHVEGIVEQTIVQGKVIKDLFRGGLDQNGRVVRL